MENHAYSDKNLEEFLQKHFGVSFGIEEVISRNLPVGYSAEATIFKSKKGRVYAFISVEARATLGDIQYILSKMNLKPTYFFPPSGFENYFFERAKVQFLEVFQVGTMLKILSFVIIKNAFLTTLLLLRLLKSAMARFVVLIPIQSVLGVRRNVILIKKF